MTNEEVIAKLKDWSPWQEIGDYDKFRDALDMAIIALEQTSWIPVSEKLPPIAQRILVSVINGEVFIARYHSFDKWTFEPTGIRYAYNKDYIVAWMPLPESYKTESEEAQPKQTDDSCLDFDFDEVKEILKEDNLDNLIVDHTCEEKQEQTRDEKVIDAIDFAIKATDSQDDYSMGMRNGMRCVKSLIDGKEPQYELRRTDEEIKLGIDLGDEVVDDYGAKGVVIGIDTYKGDVLLSLLMRNHKVPQLVKASGYKKTGRHFSQIIEVLEQIKGEADGK